MKLSFGLCIVINILLNFHFLYASSEEHLIAYYPFNGNVNDESGNNNHGQIYGPVLDIGKLNKGYKFDGDDYIDLGNSESLQLTKNFTIMLWVNISNEHNGSFVSKTYGYPGQERAIEFYISETSKSIVAYFWNSSSQFFRGTTNSIEHLMNKWIHIVLQHDSSLIEHQMRIYINGEEQELTFNYETISSIPEIKNTTETMKIGCFRPEDGEPPVIAFFKGMMDEIRIYNSVLSPNDIFKIYYDSKNTISSKTQYLWNEIYHVGDDSEWRTDLNPPKLLGEVWSSDFYIENLPSFATINFQTFEVQSSYSNTRNQLVLNGNTISYLHEDEIDWYSEQMNISSSYLISGKNTLEIISNVLTQDNKDDFLIKNIEISLVNLNNTNMDCDAIRTNDILPQTTLPLSIEYGETYSLSQIVDGITDDSTPFNGFASSEENGTISLFFENEFTIYKFLLWNDINVEAQGIRTFKLVFFNSKDSIIYESKIYNCESLLEVQEYIFDSPIRGVKKVNLVVLSSALRIEIREIEFRGNAYCHPITDSDIDGVIDEWDLCPQTINDIAIYSNGCSATDLYQNLSQLTLENDGLNHDINKLNDKIDLLNNLIIKANNTILNYSNTIISLQNEIKDQKQLLLTDQTTISNLNTMIATLQYDLEKKDKHINELTNTISNMYTEEEFNTQLQIAIDNQGYTGYSINLSEGWHLLSSINIKKIPTTIPENAIEVIYRYFDGAYLPTDQLIPKYGHWIKVNQPCELILKNK